jgi:YD repeat-containing protein
MAAGGEYLLYSYDGLGRLLAAIHRSTSSTGTEDVLYTQTWDSASAPDPGCPQPTNTIGRVLNRIDSFGTTWYQYDAWGRVVGEIRTRGGSTSCTAGFYVNPHTFYTYSLNGNLTSIKYPYGRTVTYVYGTGARLDRATSISITTWNGTAWSTLSNVISAVTWEPYGGLRAYQIAHQASGTSSAVEYALGDNGEGAPTGDICASPFPSKTSSDHTGRLRALWVSKGALTPGAGDGSIYRRVYSWRADQVKQTKTCLLAGR